MTTLGGIPGVVWAGVLGSAAFPEPDIASTKSALFAGDYSNILVGDHATLRMSQFAAFTVSMWVKFASLTAGMRLIGNHHTVGGWALSKNGATSELILDVTQYTGGAGATKTKTQDGLLTANHWHHICATRDSSGAAAGQKIYVDGKLASTVIISDDLTASCYTTNPLRIGRHYAAPFDTFDGQIDECLITRTEATSAQVQALWGRGRPDSAVALAMSPAAYWKLGDGDTTTAIDSGSLGAHGALSDVTFVEDAP